MGTVRAEISTSLAGRILLSVCVSICQCFAVYQSLGRSFAIEFALFGDSNHALVVAYSKHTFELVTQFEEPFVGKMLAK